MSKCDRPGDGSPPIKKYKDKSVSYVAITILHAKAMMGRTVESVNAGNIRHVQVSLKMSIKFSLTLH